ncbi:hypothetical protein ACFPRL_19085 [Pseudoclavibacter helvolus]
MGPRHRARLPRRAVGGRSIGRSAGCTRRVRRHARVHRVPRRAARARLPRRGLRAQVGPHRRAGARRLRRRRELGGRP